MFVYYESVLSNDVFALAKTQYFFKGLVLIRRIEKNEIRSLSLQLFKSAPMIVFDYRIRVFIVKADESDVLFYKFYALS